MAAVLNTSASTSGLYSTQRVCTLKPMEAEYSTLQLKAGKNIVGRSKETGIKDKRCSKQQLQLDVQIDKAEINLKVLGLNPCGINGLICLKNTNCVLKHGDILEIVYGKYPFEVIFKPAPPVAQTLTPANNPNPCEEVEQEDVEMCYPNRCKIDVVDKARSLEQKNMCNRKCKQGLEKMYPTHDPCKADVAKIRKNLEVVPPLDDNCDNKSTECWDSADDGKLLIYTTAGVIARDKIAAYDLDGTLIKTKSGNVFPKNNDDWELLFGAVSKRLKALHENNYKICIFTNQGGISRGSVDVNGFKQKIRAVLTKLDVPAQVFIAVDEGYFRKPLPGMWEYLEHHKNCNVRIDKRKCFFVGDAAGRPQLGAGVTKRRKDHSLADRLFASNVGVAFYTPEEHFFTKKTEEWVKPEFDPRTVNGNLPLFDPIHIKLKLDTAQLIIMVGIPGSGKSHFVKTQLVPLGFVVANADTLGTVANCIKTIDKALSSNISCVVDNTNVDVESRKKFIDIAKKYCSIRCRCFVMNTPVAQIKHNLAFRRLTDSEHNNVSTMVFNMMKKRFAEPDLSEGFDEIVRVNLKPSFSSIEHENLYKMFLVEK